MREREEGVLVCRCPVRVLASYQQLDRLTKWITSYFITSVGFTLEAKLFSSKYMIEVHLEILSRPVGNMASHLLTKSFIWNKNCQTLRSLESWNRYTCTSCTWLPFPIGQVCFQVWCRPYFRANFGFFELRTLPWAPSKVEVGYILLLHTQSRFQVHLDYTWRL